MSQHEFEIDAACHQFYLMDRKEEPDAPTDITDEDLRRRINVGPFVVAIYTGRTSTVPVSVEVWDTAPDFDLTAWDHVAEASLDLPSGEAVILGCLDGWENAWHLPALSPGCYRVRVCQAGLGTIDENPCIGADYHRIALWPAPAEEVVILKQYTPAQPEGT